MKHVAPAWANSEVPPPWAPDAFAIVSSILQASGGYRSVAAAWPPRSGAKSLWSDRIEALGSRWRKAYNASREPKRLPAAVRSWWSTLHSRRSTPLTAVAADLTLCRALLQLLAAADTACAGVGLPESRSERDRTTSDALLHLWKTSRSSCTTGATLCSTSIRPHAARVLPKLHTPQKGMTLRSLSHNLAFTTTDEVIPRWMNTVDFSTRSHDLMLNALLIPWPEAIGRHQFHATPEGRRIPCRMPPGFDFFSFEKESAKQTVRDRLSRIYKAALREAGTIELVILPELALDPGEYQEARAWAQQKGLYLITGVGDARRNYVAQEVPFFPGESTPVEQPKHHRWKLDRSQIETYGLGGHLNPATQWWEHMQIDDRTLWFVSLLPWLTVCVLVCEDLAQQEPVARIVRAIGPNLVIALLMDGPQLSTRWPARYATVLADDPGSSVLTLTSLGMCERSRPAGYPPSRTVALWKDYRNQREIGLGAGAQAVVLNLLVERREEWTADGRNDGSQTGAPVLVGAYDVIVSEPDAPQES